MQRPPELEQIPAIQKERSGDKQVLSENITAEAQRTRRKATVIASAPSAAILDGVA